MSQMEKEGFGEEFFICSSFCFGEIRGGFFGGLVLTIPLFNFCNQTFYRSPFCFAFLNLTFRDNFSNGSGKFHLCKIMFLCVKFGRKKFFHLFYSGIFRRNFGFSNGTISSAQAKWVIYLENCLTKQILRQNILNCYNDWVIGECWNCIHSVFWD